MFSFCIKTKNAVNPIKNEIGLGAFFVTRKVKISFLIVVWSIVAIQIFVNYQEKIKQENHAVTAFSLMGDTVFTEKINGYGYFGTMDISDVEKRKMLKNLAYKLGITEGYDFQGGSGDYYTKCVLTKKGENGNTTLQIISMDNDGGEPEQYIVMDLEIHTEFQKAHALFQKVKRIYEEIGVDARTGLEIEAEQKGNKIKENDTGLVDHILKAAKAKQVDTVSENGIYTIYGYTKQESSYMELNGKKVNIQIVMVYDEKEDKTYLKIGIPIVNSSY